MHTVQLARRFVKEDWGGTETVVLETSKRLLGMGHNVEVLSTLATADSESADIDGLSVRRYPYFYPYLGLSENSKNALDRKGGSPFSFSLMRALFNLPDLDLLHIHCGNRIGGIGRYVAMKRAIPYVVSIHGGVFDVPPDEAASWTAPTKGAIDWGKALGLWVGSRRVLSDAHAILCVGYEESLRVKQNFPRKKVVYLPNGVDTTRFSSGDGETFRSKHNIPPDAKVILTVARIDRQKNQHLPVRLLSSLQTIEPKTHLLIIGNVTNPSYYQELRALADSSGSSKDATIIPGIPSDSQDLVDAYHAADLFLLPSLHEPFGIVILEAWSAGLPVIASNVGGIPHFLIDGEDGLLFNPADDDSLVRAFKQVCQDTESANRLASTGQKKALKEFDWDVITRRLQSLYEEVIDENTLHQ